MYPAVQAGPFQRTLDILHGALAPRVFLLNAVDRDEGLLEHWGHLGPDVGLGIEHLGRRHPSLEEGQLNLGPPPVRLRLDDPAQAVGGDPEPPFDDDGAEPHRELELDRGHDRQLLLADVILGPRLGEADGLADHPQKVEGDPRSVAQLLERSPADPGEPIVGARVQVGERECSVPYGGGHPVERNAGLVPAPHPTRPAHITG